MTLAPNLVLANQSIGDALSFADFQGVDGIVGVGPVVLTQGTLSPDTNALIPTVMNNLVSQGLIADQVLGVYFAPATNDNDTSEYSCLAHQLKSDMRRWRINLRRHRFKLGKNTILVSPSRA